MEAKCVRVKRSGRGWKGIFLRIPPNCKNAILFTLYRMKFLRSTALRLYFTQKLHSQKKAARASSTVNQNFVYWYYALLTL